MIFQAQENWLMLIAEPETQGHFHTIRNIKGLTPLTAQAALNKLYGERFTANDHGTVITITDNKKLAQWYADRIETGTKFKDKERIDAYLKKYEYLIYTI